MSSAPTIAPRRFPLTCRASTTDSAFVQLRRPEVVPTCRVRGSGPIYLPVLAKSARAPSCRMSRARSRLRRTPLFSRITTLLPISTPPKTSHPPICLKPLSFLRSVKAAAQLHRTSPVTHGPIKLNLSPPSKKTAVERVHRKASLALYGKAPRSQLNLLATRQHRLSNVQRLQIAPLLREQLEISAGELPRDRVGPSSRGEPPGVVYLGSSWLPRSLLGL